MINNKETSIKLIHPKLLKLNIKSVEDNIEKYENINKQQQQKEQERSINLNNLNSKNKLIINSSSSQFKSDKERNEAERELHLLASYTNDQINEPEKDLLKEKSIPLYSTTTNNNENNNKFDYTAYTNPHTHHYRFFTPENNIKYKFSNLNTNTGINNNNTIRITDKGIQLYHPMYNLSQTAKINSIRKEEKYYKDNIDIKENSNNNTNKNTLSKLHTKTTAFQTMKDGLLTNNEDFKEIYYNNTNNINNINNKEDLIKNENDKLLEDRIIHFHQDPYHFLDRLVEKYFNSYLKEINIDKTKAISDSLNNNNTNITTLLEEIKKSIKENIINEMNFYNNTNSKEDYKAQHNNNLKQTIKEVLTEVLANNNNITNGNNNTKINNLILESEPLNQQELLTKLLNQESNNFVNINEFNSKIHNKQDIYKSCLNNPFSQFSNYNLKLTREVLHCLKGEKIIPPKTRFYSVYDKLESAETEATKNLLNIQKQFNVYENGFENEVMKHLQNSINQEQKIYDEYIGQTKTMMKEMEDKLIDSEQLMDKIFNKIDVEFEERLVKRGLDELKLVNSKLDKVKNDIILREEYIEHNKERLNMNLDITDKMNRKVEMFLRENGDCEEFRKTKGEWDLDYNYDKNNKERYNDSKYYGKYGEIGCVDDSVMNDSELNLLYQQYAEFSSKRNLNNMKEGSKLRNNSKNNKRSNSKNRKAVEAYSKKYNSNIPVKSNKQVNKQVMNRNNSKYGVATNYNNVNFSNNKAKSKLSNNSKTNIKDKPIKDFVF